MYRAIIITTIGGEEHWYDVVKLFRQFQIDPPTTNDPVISMELRGAIAQYGVTRSIFENDEARMNRYIPPYEIKYVDFYMSLTPPDEERLDKLIKKGLK